MSGMASEKTPSASATPSTPAPVQGYTASSCHVYPTQWVLQLVFGEAAPTPSGQVVEIPRFMVGLPWPLAKAIYQIVGGVIDEYEKAEGPIVVPASIQKQIDEMKRAAITRGAADSDEQSGEPTK
jgi:hypothetical protein